MPLHKVINKYNDEYDIFIIELFYTMLLVRAQKNFKFTKWWVNSKWRLIFEALKKELRFKLMMMPTLLFEKMSFKNF
jgi:hypothetical protein